MYIRDDLNYIIRDDISVKIDGKLESVFVEAHLKTVNCMFGEIYQVPNASEILSISYYQTILNNLQHIQNVIVLGIILHLKDNETNCQTCNTRTMDNLRNPTFIKTLR